VEAAMPGAGVGRWLLLLVAIVIVVSLVMSAFAAPALR
jgi:hypothetical protein